MAGEKVVLIENEFGEIGVDGDFLEEAGIEIREMNSGCICCSLVGDFSESLKEVIDKYSPERIIIEPSGVGKLSDVIKAVEELDMENEICINSTTAVVNVKKCKIYMKNFGEFFINQVSNANCIVLSRTSDMSEEKLNQVTEMLRVHSDKVVVTTPWEELTGKIILETMEEKSSMEEKLMNHVEHHHGETCCCGGHGHHEGHYHHNDSDCCGGAHSHEDHHHHHHADEVFDSWGIETVHSYRRSTIEGALNQLGDSGEFGMILRAKGMLACEDGGWTHFDYVPGEVDVRTGGACATGKICVIGSELDKEKIASLFIESEKN